jgi:hypothetical protein
MRCLCVSVSKSICSNLYCQFSASFLPVLLRIQDSQFKSQANNPTSRQATYPLTHHFSCFQGR